METAKVLEEAGGIVVGIGCIVDRKVCEIQFPVYSSIELFFETYDDKNCHLCEMGSKPIKPGSRKF